MNPSKEVSENIRILTYLPNIDKVGVADLALFGIDKPEDFVGQDHYEMYEKH